MQWLIDIVSERIRQYGMFVDRGDPTASDWTQATLTADGTWRVLDLSGIVDKHANAVLMLVGIKDDLINNRIRFRTHGNASVYNVTEVRIQVAGIAIAADVVVPLSADRKIEYRLDAVVWTSVFIVVKGWWF